jgi:hypothetical protein
MIKKLDMSGAYLIDSSPTKVIKARIKCVIIAV